MSIGNSPAEDRPSVDYADDVPDDVTEDLELPGSVTEDIKDNRPSVGQALRQARTDAGLTVEEVSSTTRVRIPIIQAIEQDDFTRCGGDVYARGHIRTLARAVGIASAPLVEQYDADHGGRPAPTPAAPLYEAERMRPERRRPNWTAAMVAAIVAVVAFLGFTLFSGDQEPVKSASGNESASAKPTSPPSNNKSSAPTPEPSDSAIAAAPADKVTVKLTAKGGSSWISAKDHSGRLLNEGVLKKGQSKTFTDKQRIDLVLGNAGAIQLFVNGKEVDDRYEKGQVQRLSYTKGDPAAG